MTDMSKDFESNISRTTTTGAQGRGSKDFTTQGAIPETNHRVLYATGIAALAGVVGIGTYLYLLNNADGEGTGPVIPPPTGIDQPTNSPMPSQEPTIPINTPQGTFEVTFPPSPSVGPQETHGPKTLKEELTEILEDPDAFLDPLDYWAGGEGAMNYGWRTNSFGQGENGYGYDYATKVAGTIRLGENNNRLILIFQDVNKKPIFVRVKLGFPQYPQVVVYTKPGNTANWDTENSYITTSDALAESFSSGNYANAEILTNTYSPNYFEEGSPIDKAVESGAKSSNILAKLAKNLLEKGIEEIDLDPNADFICTNEEDLEAFLNPTAEQATDDPYTDFYLVRVPISTN